MIECIAVSKVATFHPTTAEVLDDLCTINYIFGSNGTGKTTISRVIADVAFSTSCTCTWKDGSPLDAVVLNRDFVEKNFDQLRGVFTLGEKQKSILEKIGAAKQEVDNERESLAKLMKNLKGDDGVGGKKGELTQLEADYRDKFWVPVERLKRDGKLVDALHGVLNNKEACKNKIIIESETNTAALTPLAELEQRATTIFGQAPTREALIQKLDTNSLLTHESNPILKKNVIGKEDVDIAAMITKLGNSDWVRQGLPYYAANDRLCPFCQQETNEAFARSLGEYFDETFEHDSSAINTLVSQYATDASAIQLSIEEIIKAPSVFLNAEKLQTERIALNQTVEANQLRLANKLKEPSTVVELVSLRPVFARLQRLIHDAQLKAREHNRRVDNLSTEEPALIAEVWQYVLNELEVDLNQYRQKKAALDRAIAGIESTIRETEARIDAKTEEIRELEKQTTSIQPTIDSINRILLDFGFDSFKLAMADDGKHYKLIRKSGEDAGPTLSEGERTFVVFLYFYHLLKGSMAESGMTVDRVVVFDDPVSSLDSDVLFIVSTLIREVCETARTGKGHIRQVFVLTHNIYFHKEVTFDKRPKANRPKDETFWLVRKVKSHSKVKRYDENPIKTSYELLWMEVREAQRALEAVGTTNPRIENTLRRILEHYFLILGSIDLHGICDGFDGQDKCLCRSLLSWVNAGSHAAFDDAHITPSDGTRESYLRVFEEIFRRTGHTAHYMMMMGGAQIESS